MTDADLPIVTLKKDSKLYRRGFKQPVKKATGWQWFANERGGCGAAREGGAAGLRRPRGGQPAVRQAALDAGLRCLQCP